MRNLVLKPGDVVRYASEHGDLADAGFILGKTYRVEEIWDITRVRHNLCVRSLAGEVRDLVEDETMTDWAYYFNKVKRPKV